jgi:hypothetical protein
MYLAEDRGQWWAFVNTVTNLLGPTKGEEFPDQMSDYQLLEKDSIT